MKKHLLIIQATWAEYMAYRLSFVLWRVRMVIQLLAIYFLWRAIFSGDQELFGYTQTSLLTYIVLTSFVRPIVMSTRSLDLGGMINDGSLSNFLIRPFSVFQFFVSRDAADKALNLVFAVGEIALILLILRPPVFLQMDGATLLLSTVALGIGVVLFFLSSMIISALGFWTPDVWALRFLSFILTEFFAGLLFPLDILPQRLFEISQLLPFSYFIYFPLKIYTGGLTLSAIMQGLGIGTVWIVGLGALYLHLWRRGLAVYTAEGT